MTDANELDIDAVRARVEAATPGPWQAKAHPTRANSLTVQGDNLFLAHYVHRAENAEFIAHARTDLPAALDEITRLRAALDEARAEVETHREVAESMTGLWEQEKDRADRLESVADRLADRRANHEPWHCCCTEGSHAGQAAALNRMKDRAEAAERERDEARAEVERMTRGSRCPQCSASEWNQASIQRRRAESAEQERDAARAERDEAREQADSFSEQLLAERHDHERTRAAKQALSERAANDLLAAESALAAVRALHAREKGYGFAADCPDAENHRYAPGYDGDELCLDCPTGEHWWCRTCHDEDGDPVEWPCPTALAYGAEPRRPGLEASSASNEQQSAPFAIPTTVERSESDD